MTGCLLDTNVISELRKPTANKGVVLWMDSQPEENLFVSVLTLGELRNGVVRLEDRDPDQATLLNGWLRRITEIYEDRVVGINTATADMWGHITAPRPLPVVDSLLAATCLVHDLSLISRNTADFADIDGLSLLNPWL